MRWIAIQVGIDCGWYGDKLLNIAHTHFLKIVQSCGWWEWDIWGAVVVVVKHNEQKC